MRKFEKDAYAEVARARQAIPGGVPRGRFWFSKKQRAILDRNGRDRLYFKRLDGQVLEYTEMIDAADLVKYPALWPTDFEDAVLLGDGEYFGRVSM